DDSLYKYMNLLDGTYVLTNLNIQESLVKYEELYDLVQDLEVPYLVAEVLNDSGVAFETAGEYDLAISSHLEQIEVLGEEDTPCLRLSYIFSTLGDGKEALEWANRAFEYAGTPRFPTLFLMKAWALALLNRLEEAASNLNTAHSLIMKTGQEIKLAQYYHISGVIELARCDYLIALDLLEKGQEIAVRLTRGLYLNPILLDLARAEILLANQSTESTNAPGRWLSKLEKYAIEQDLPGIRMYAALFKSEFYQNQGQLKDAHATLQDALNITDSLGVMTLRKKIKDRIHELNQLLREEEVSTEKRKG
ncbi:MAG: hypothetical protein ACXABN_18755, partial [Candidatus Thorarchaeota archaeon]